MSNRCLLWDIMGTHGPRVWFLISAWLWYSGLSCFSASSASKRHFPGLFFFLIDIKIWSWKTFFMYYFFQINIYNLEHKGMTQRCTRGGSEFILGKVSLLWWWLNTETGFLSRWLMSHIHQCSGGIWIMLSLMCFNFWWALKCPNSETRWSLEGPSNWILIIVVISKNKITRDKRDFFYITKGPLLHESLNWLLDIFEK